MNLEESKLFMLWFEKNKLKNNDVGKIEWDEATIIYYNIIKRNYDRIESLDCYKDFYNEILLPLNREKKIKELGI